MSVDVGNGGRLARDFAARAVEVDSFPSVMYVESTQGCPYSCIMCSVPARQGRKSRDIAPELIEKVSPWFRYLKILAIHGAGEPLLSRNLGYFADAARDNDVILRILTTGFPLTREVAATLLRAKLHVAFSMHAGTPETYARIMGGHDLDRTLRNIAWLTRESARIGAPENEFWFSFTVVKEVIDEIDDLLDMASRVGIGTVRFMRLKPTPEILRGVYDKKQDFRYSYLEQSNRRINELFLKKLPRIRERAAGMGINIHTGNMEFAARENLQIREVARKVQKKLLPDVDVLPLVKRRAEGTDAACVAPWTGQLQIRQNGNVHLCCGVSPPIILGNLYEKNLDEIWNDRAIRAIREDFRKGEFPRACGYCEGIQPDYYGVDLFEDAAPRADA